MELTKSEALLYFGPDGPARDVIGYIEDVTNKIFYEKPEDIYGYIVKYFEKLCSRPILTKIYARFAMTKNWPSFHINIHVKVHNNIKVFRSSASSNFSKSFENINNHLNNIEKSIDVINDIISPKYFNVYLDNQVAVDECLKEFLQFCQIELKAKQCSGHISRKYSEKSSIKSNSLSTSILEKDEEELLPSLLSIAAISRALCVVSSNLAEQPLYQYLSDSFEVNTICQFSMPVPLMTVPINSRAENSKLKQVKEFLLIPAPHIPPYELMLAVVKILLHFQLAAEMEDSSKKNEKNTFDGPDEVIEMLDIAVSQAGYFCGKDFFLGLNCAANEIYQEDKDSYETNAGVFKSGTELRKMWLELLYKRPSIICLIDPFHQKSKDEWTKLCGQISTKCSVIASHFNYPQECEKKESFQSSGIMISFDNLNTVSDIWLNAFKNKAQNFLLLLACEGETCDTFPIDMAVALRAAFIKIGNISATETSANLNRLAQIYEELEFSDRMIQPCSHHTFHQVGEFYKEEEIEDDASIERELVEKPSKAKRSRGNK